MAFGLSLSAAAYALLIRLCREPEDQGVTLEILGEADTVLAGELFDAGAVETVGELVRVRAWVHVWRKAEPERPKAEILATDLVTSEDGPTRIGARLNGAVDPKAVDPKVAAVASVVVDRSSYRSDWAKINLPPPTILLAGRQPWPPKGSLSLGGKCPVCRGRKLSRLTYCLWCDRWGLEKFLPSEEAAEEQAPANEWKATRDVGLAGGKGKTATG